MGLAGAHSGACPSANLLIPGTEKFDRWCTEISLNLVMHLFIIIPGGLLQSAEWWEQPQRGSYRHTLLCLICYRTAAPTSSADEPVEWVLNGVGLMLKAVQSVFWDTWSFRFFSEESQKITQAEAGVRARTLCNETLSVSKDYLTTLTDCWLAVWLHITKDRSIANHYHGCCSLMWPDRT